MIKVFIDFIGCKGYLWKDTNPYFLTLEKTTIMERYKINLMLGVLLLLC
jgi:hypothetical protein